MDGWVERGLKAASQVRGNKSNRAPGGDRDCTPKHRVSSQHPGSQARMEGANRKGAPNKEPGDWHRSTTVTSKVRAPEDSVKMAARITPILVFLLASCYVTSSYNHCKPPEGEGGYNRFLRQHYNNPKTHASNNNNYCDKMMHLQCMTNQDPPKTKCKDTNTFIHTTKNMIKAVCDEAGSPYGNNLRVSNNPFSVTTCKCKNSNLNVHPCAYKGTIDTRRIVIRCEDKLPVHFEEGIFVPH